MLQDQNTKYWIMAALIAVAILVMLVARYYNS
jgi:predicted Co/Zn/Cd cation transporter (cation efflux family)